MKLCEKYDCTGCGVCAAVCPVNCITMRSDSEGFFYPVPDEKACIHCGRCDAVCPSRYAVRNESSEFYMAIHKNEAVLSQSSSGGAFTALADMVLQKNGVVIGASMDDNTCTVSHIPIESDGDIKKLRFSKYCQSATTDIFGVAQKFLKEDRYVLFSGTGCQIAALCSVLRDPLPEKLITVEVLCFGVTSEKVVQSYLACKEKQYHRRVKQFQFRTKEPGYSFTSPNFQLNDGTRIVQEKEADTLAIAYTSGMILRESCYRCKYGGRKRVADFSIGDFWGVSEKRATEAQKARGISLLLVNSKKAGEWIGEIAKEMELTPIEPQEALPYNIPLQAPVPRPNERDELFRRLG